MRHLPRGVYTGSRGTPGSISEVGGHWSPLIWDMELQHLEFALLGLSHFGSAFPHYTLIPLFGDEDAYRCLLEVRNLTFLF